MQPTMASGLLSPWEPGVLSLGVYGILVLALIAAFLFLSSWLGEKRPTPEKRRPYEGGIIPTGSTRFPYPVAFYLVAAFFLIFDIEAAYVFSWAIAFERLGWTGWLQISFFLIVLLISLVYVWKKGGLDWDTGSRKR